MGDTGTLVHTLELITMQCVDLRLRILRAIDHTVSKDTKGGLVDFWLCELAEGPSLEIPAKSSALRHGY